MNKALVDAILARQKMARTTFRTFPLSRATQNCRMRFLRFIDIEVIEKDVLISL